MGLGKLDEGKAKTLLLSELLFSQASQVVFGRTWHYLC